MHNPLHLPRKTTSERSKVVRKCGALCILTWKCASRHNGVHLLDRLTSKIGPSMVCFVHFDLEMCFAPQPSALFRHVNFQKLSEHEVVCSILTWKRASRHNSVQFFISHLTTWLHTRRFSELILFDPPEPQIIRKTQYFATFSYLFVHLHLLSSDSFSSLIFLLLSLLFSDSSHLCFSSLHNVGSLTSNFLR